MATLSPSWSDNVSIVAARNLSRGSTYRTTFDWRSKPGGRLMIRIGKQGTTGLSNGVDVIVRPTNNNDGTIHPGPVFQSLTQTASANSTTVNSESISCQHSVNVASVTAFAAGDYFCIVDASFTPSRLEFHRVSKTAAGVITADTNLKTSHTSAQADRVVNKADC